MPGSMKYLSARFAALLLGLLLPIAASAHPAVKISYWMDFRLDSSGLAGIEETWRFDAKHSEQILEMFDANHNGVIDPSELPALERGYFDNLARYSFFTTIVADGEPVAAKVAKDFSAEYRDHRMYYRFFLPLEIPASSRTREVDVTVWDPTYFTDMEPGDEAAVTVHKPRDITARIYSANDHRHFYNIAPDVRLIKKPPFYLQMQVLEFGRTP
ncbi:MAG: DUF1007 family protein [Treponema sp.]|nr:DUF1007 family protein [Treponema sp.]